MAGIAKQKNQRRTGEAWYARINRQRGSKSAGLREGFRSGLEERNAKLLEANKVPFEFEGVRIPYIIPEKRHTYTPDFHLLPNGIIVETKGKFENHDRAKHVLIRAQYPELDIRLVFSRPEDKLYKGSNTTYAQWCHKQGIKWANKLIPHEWWRERGPSKRPAEVLAAGPRFLR